MILFNRILGTPNETIWPGVTELQEYKANFPGWIGKPLSTVCPTIGKLGCDLLQVRQLYTMVTPSYNYHVFINSKCCYITPAKECLQRKQCYIRILMTWTSLSFPLALLKLIILLNIIMSCIVLYHYSYIIIIIIAVTNNNATCIIER